MSPPSPMAGPSGHAELPAEIDAALDAVVGPAPTWSPPPTRARRDLLLPALHAVHDAAGWLSPEALAAIAARLGLGKAEVYGVATFYGSFALEPRPRRVRRICTDIACLARGARPPAGDDPGLLAASCLGRCDQAPAALVTEGGHDRGGPLPAPVHQPRHDLRLLRRVGIVDPRRLDDHLAHGGGRALAHARRIGAEAVRAVIGASGLTGRGGAAFPAGRKWDAVARAPGAPKYVVCNADESEPGTFKDRVLLEHDPFTIVEAMTIAAWAVGATRGFVYVRDEYPAARAAIEHAVACCAEAGLLGDDAAGLGHPFSIEVRRGAGAYVCGEETALFNSIEGHRGEPRTRPPFPVDAGLFGRPTLVHNVETLANVVHILDEPGPDDRRAGPTVATRLCCVSGNVTRPGVYEVRPTTTLGELVGLAGGVVEGHALQAVLLGGAAGMFVRPDQLGVALTPEATSAVGASLGSGAAIVFDDTVDLAEVVLRIAEFFRDESCGQCVPCRVGTVRQLEALRRLAARRPLGSVPDELARLRDVGAAMRDASICGLGQMAANAVGSAVDGLGILTGSPS